MVLALQNMRVFLKGLFLSKKITVAGSILRLKAPLIFNFTTASVESFLAFLKSEFSVTKLNRQIGIAAFSKLNCFTSFKVIRLLAFAVS